MESGKKPAASFQTCPREVQDMIIIATIKGCLADHMKHTESRSEIPNPHGRCLDFTNQTSYAFCVDFCIPVLEKMSLDLSNCKDLAIEQYKDMCRARMERGDREEFDEDIAAAWDAHWPYDQAGELVRHVLRAADLRVYNRRELDYKAAGVLYDIAAAEASSTEGGCDDEVD